LGFCGKLAREKFSEAQQKQPQRQNLIQQQKQQQQNPLLQQKQRRKKRRRKQGQRGAALKVSRNHKRQPCAGSKSNFSEDQSQKLACRSGKATPGPNLEQDLQPGELLGRRKIRRGAAGGILRS
jgi:hypothetical protein